MQDKIDRKILCHDQIVYIDKDGLKYYSDTITGEFANEIYEDGEPLNSIHNLVKVNGKYLKEHHTERWANLVDEKRNWNNFAEFLKSRN